MEGEAAKGSDAINTAAKGNKKELASARILQSEGWLVASRRHLPGPGDLLATKQGERPRLIEVKCTRTPYEHFRQVDRIALREYAALHGAVAELAWWKPRASSHEIVDEASWP